MRSPRPSTTCTGSRTAGRLTIGMSWKQSRPARHGKIKTANSRCRNEHNRKIKDVKTETQATERSRAANRGKRVARHWPHSVGAAILGQAGHISLDSIEA